MSLDRANFIYATISAEYSKMLASVNNTHIQNQLVETTITNNGVLCNKCLGVFIADPTDYNKNSEVIDRLRGVTTSGVVTDKNALCFTSCVTLLDKTTITNYMNFDVKNFINPSDEDIKKLVDSINKQILEKYKDSSDDDIKKIVINLTKVDFSHLIDISQLANSYQIITINGPGTITNLNMTIMSDIVLKAIVDDRTSVDLVNGLSEKMVKSIQKKIQKGIMSNFSYVWSKLKTFIIVTAVVFLCIIISIVFMLFFRSYYG